MITTKFYFNANVYNPVPHWTVTNCFPLTMYVIGPAETDGPRLVSHRSLPSRASSAMNWPSRPPANKTFEAVVSTPPSVDGADMRKVDRRCLVFGSIAMMELN